MKRYLLNKGINKRNFFWMKLNLIWILLILWFRIKELLLQNFSFFCQKNTDLWHIAYIRYLSTGGYVELLVSLFDYLKENHLDILKAKNSLGMNLLMYAIGTQVRNPVSINKDFDQVFLVSHMIDSKVYDLNDQAVFPCDGKFHFHQIFKLIWPTKDNEIKVSTQSLNLKCLFMRRNSLIYLIKQ